MIAVHDVGPWEESIFIAMEYVQGSTLVDWVAHKAPGWREVVHVFLQAGRGLEAAHANGLVHRDVKPANILLGNDGRVRITDFGLATAAVTPMSSTNSTREEPESGGLLTSVCPVEMDPSQAVDTLTRTGALLGTPAYMALEQLEGRHADSQSDQFSFCVSLYEALSGQRPFRGDSLAELTRRVRYDTISVVALAGVPAPVISAIRRGLQRRPEDRFPSMTSLLETLERATDVSPSRAHSWAQLPTAVSVAALVVALASLILWVVFRPADNSQPSRSVQSEPTVTAASQSTFAVNPDSSAPLSASAVLPSNATTAGHPLPTGRRPMRARILKATRMRRSGVQVRPAVLQKVHQKHLLWKQAFHLKMEIHRLEKSGQGKRCLSAFKKLGKLNPGMAKLEAYNFALCTLRAGNCAQGKKLLRRYLKRLPHQIQSNIDYQVIRQASLKCPTNKQTLPEQYRTIARRIGPAQRNKATATCDRLMRQLLRILPKLLGALVPPLSVQVVSTTLLQGAHCLGKAGRCGLAKRVWAAAYRLVFGSKLTAARLKVVITQTMRQSFPKCVSP